MTDQAAAVTIYVTYQGTPESRFDRDYYVESHVPLVSRSWGKYGLDSIAAFFPAVNAAGTLCICECRFRDQAAADTAFSSPEAPEVNGDVVHFTDITPVLVKAVSL